MTSFVILLFLFLLNFNVCSKCCTVDLKKLRSGSVQVFSPFPLWQTKICAWLVGKYNDIINNFICLTTLTVAVAGFPGRLRHQESRVTHSQYDRTLICWQKSAAFTIRVHFFSQYLHCVCACANDTHSVEVCVQLIIGRGQLPDMLKDKMLLCCDKKDGDICVGFCFCTVSYRVWELRFKVQLEEAERQNWNYTDCCSQCNRKPHDRLQ